MAKTTESLSIHQARKLVLLSQRVPPAKQTGNAIDATLASIEHLGYIQIDTISAVHRAHHHTLWNRNPHYSISHIEKLISDRQVYEYWSHAAAYLPMKDFRYSLPRKQAIASGKEKHWYLRDDKLMDSILNRIATEGPLMAKDFESEWKNTKDWGSKPVKQALGNLFMQGDLMIASRRNFHKVYDLTENVLPDNIDYSMPTEYEYAQYLIISYLRANGIGQSSEISYLLKNVKAQIARVLQDMFLKEELLLVNVGETNYYALPESLKLLAKPISRSQLNILSPFDNLLIQRKRTKEIFGFDYQLECYVPEAKRKHGYFVLPVLWNGRLIARMDCKADRKKSVLNIYSLTLESHLKKTEAFARALTQELVSFLKFNDCSSIRLHSTNPPGFQPELVKVIRELI